VVDNTIKLPVLTSLVHDGGLTAVLSAARCIAGCELRHDAWNGVREAMALATAKVMDLVAAACGSMSDEYPTEMDYAMDEASAEIARGTLLRATHSVLRTSLAPYVTGAVSLDRLPVFGFVQAIRRVIQHNDDLLDDLLDDQVKYVDGSPGATLEALTCSLSGFLTDFVGFGFGSSGQWSQPGMRVPLPSQLWQPIEQPWLTELSSSKNGVMPLFTQTVRMRHARNARTVCSMTGLRASSVSSFFALDILDESFRR
jgi:hypothetical protein